jgi:hypothetical protein
MLRFGLIEKRPVFTEYAARLAARPAYQRMEAVNARVREEHGLE